MRPTRSGEQQIAQTAAAFLTILLDTRTRRNLAFCRNHGGYTFGELYATTYANGAQGNPLQWATYKMECSYVKTVRALIVAVRLYTGRAVDVIGYSLGRRRAHFFISKICF